MNRTLPLVVRGKRGRGASGKQSSSVFFKRNGKVYTEIVPDEKTQSASHYSWLE